MQESASSISSRFHLPTVHSVSTSLALGSKKEILWLFLLICSHVFHHCRNVKSEKYSFHSAVLELWHPTFPQSSNFLFTDCRIHLLLRDPHWPHARIIIKHPHAYFFFAIEFFQLVPTKENPLLAFVRTCKPKGLVSTVAMKFSCFICLEKNTKVWWANNHIMADMHQKKVQSIQSFMITYSMLVQSGLWGTHRVRFRYVVH